MTDKLVKETVPGETTQDCFLIYKIPDKQNSQYSETSNCIGDSKGIGIIWINWDKICKYDQIKRDKQEIWYQQYQSKNKSFYQGSFRDPDQDHDGNTFFQEHQWSPGFSHLAIDIDSMVKDTYGIASPGQYFVWETFN